MRLPRDLATFDTFLAELALWERRWTDAEQAVRDGLARARSREMAQIRVWLAAKGVRAQAELAALARARRDAGALRLRIRRARALLVVARRAVEASAAVTPNAAGWLALAEAEYERAKAEDAARVVVERGRHVASAPAACPLWPTAVGAKPKRW